MSLGVIPTISFEFWGNFWRKKNVKRRNQEYLAFTGPFATAKGTFAAAKCFATMKGCLTAERPKG